MDEGLSRKLLRAPIAMSRARLLLAYLVGLWLRRNVRVAHVSLHRNSRCSFFRRAHDSFDFGGSLLSERSLRFLDVSRLLRMTLVI